MHIRLKVIVSIFALGALLASCNKKTDDPDPNAPKKVEDLIIPANFNFETTTSVDLSISDYQDGATYQVYSLKDSGPNEIVYTETDTLVVIDDLNQLVAQGMVSNGSYHTVLTLPSYHNYLYLLRGKDGIFHGESVSITGSEVQYNFDGSGLKAFALADDQLYAINGSNTEVNQIDLGTGAVTQIGSLPFKSIANACDKVNNRMYVANKTNPFQLGHYDLATGVTTTVGNFPFNFPRMDYNPDDGLLYLSKGNKLYKADPANAQIIQTYTITGLTAASYCDLAFTPSGDMYIGDKNELYATQFSGNTVIATKISDPSLPNNLTCLAAGSNGKLYTTQVNANNRIIEFDPTDATWVYYPINASIKINDFGIIRAIEPSTGDVDGDGVPDEQDDYPADPERAFNNYFPGEGLWAALAFEDLWPARGDYDFNDLVIHYNINQVTNASNMVVEIKANFDAKHNGASFINGFAFQLPVDASTVASASGYNMTGSSVSLESNGLISNLSKAAVLVFDQTDPNLGNPLLIEVLFNNPQDPTALGNPPYNPYIIVDEQINHEVHLPDAVPTTLANMALFGTVDDNSDPNSGRYYKSVNNMPWAINIVYDFVWLKESHQITQGYLKFADWAESGGTLYPDWYKDLPDYRDNSHLDIQ